MDLFRVETGAAPGQSCSEERMPILKRSPRKDEAPLNPKVFLINDSLASIANISLMFTDTSNRFKASTFDQLKMTLHNTIGPYGLITWIKGFSNLVETCFR